ncbi:hypothetical protein B296_00022578 [Ensete ventricosum]|uniref:Uncharacterized protein n=1 Tax=Ensete ventricosum TaxID=4639 RepID=A0A427AL39_ENSVE|nr:hypothetical protein B296_00022578 [Ensete ventricosum]
MQGVLIRNTTTLLDHAKELFDHDFMTSRSLKDLASIGDGIPDDDDPEVLALGLPNLVPLDLAEGTDLSLDEAEEDIRPNRPTEETKRSEVAEEIGRKHNPKEAHHLLSDEDQPAHAGRLDRADSPSTSRGHHINKTYRSFLVVQRHLLICEKLRSSFPPTASAPLLRLIKTMTKSTTVSPPPSTSHCSHRPRLFLCVLNTTLLAIPTPEPQRRIHQVADLPSSREFNVGHLATAAPLCYCVLALQPLKPQLCHR